MPSTTPGHSLLSRRALVGHSAMAGRSHRVTSGASAAALCRWAILGAALAFTFVAAPLSSQTVDERLQGFDQWVESMMAEWKVPGLGVAIVEDGEIVFAKGCGWRNVEQELPVTPDTLFAIGSNTKSFTATLLAMQVDEGALAWDAPIRTVLPEFRLHDPVATGQMTAVDLLSHRSGPAQARPVLVCDRQEPHRADRRAAPPGALRLLQEQVPVPEPDVPHRRRGR